jgi:hypothetical protein
MPALGGATGYLNSEPLGPPSYAATAVQEWVAQLVGRLAPATIMTARHRETGTLACPSRSPSRSAANNAMRCKSAPSCHLPTRSQYQDRMNPSRHPCRSGGDGHAYNALENRLFVDEPANRSLSVVELLRCYRR